MASRSRRGRRRRWSGRFELHRFQLPRRRRSRRRSWLRDRPGVAALLWVGGIFAAVLIVAGVIAALQLRRAASDLKQARDILRTVETQVTEGHLAEAQANLSHAQTIIAHANGSVYGGLEYTIIGWIPVVHQNLTAIRSSVGLAYTMVNGGSQILATAKPLQGANGRLDVSLVNGRVPLQTLVAVEAQTAQLATVLPGRDTHVSGTWLLGPVEDLQRTVHDEAVKRQSQLEVLSRGMALLDEMAGANGPQRYVIGVANTAEERGAGGMILSYGELDGANGQFTLGKFDHVDGLPPLYKPVGTTLPDDYRARWDGFAYDTNFRQSTLSADFPTVAPVVSQLYAASTSLANNGVIQIDPAGLAAILKNTGPVQVDGVGLVGAQNVVDYSINQAYFQYPDRDARQSILGDIAHAAFAKLLAGQYPSLRQMATDISSAVAGRHILMWSQDNVAATQLRFFDADGALPAANSNYVSLAVLNLSGNKLDYYLDTSLDLRTSTTRASTSLREIDATVKITNTAPPDGTLRYVFGPFNANEVRGRYHGVVSLYVPAGTTLVGSDGQASTSPGVYSENGHEVISFEINTDAGATNTITLHLAMVPAPANDPTLVLVPQPRVRPTAVTVALTGPGSGPIQGSVVLDHAWALSPGAPPAPASGPALAGSRTD